MDRRRFLLTSLAGALAVRLEAHAQSRKVYRVGWLGGGTGLSVAEHQNSPQFRAFADGLRQVGFALNADVSVDARLVGPDNVEQYAVGAQQLIADRVDVLLAINPYSLAAATRVTGSVPIVGVDLESDPVAEGWAATLARPGRNLTGIFLDIPELMGKYLQLLMEARPSPGRVAVLGDVRVNTLQFEATEAAARRVGLTVIRLAVRSPNDINAISDVAKQGAKALVVLTSPLVSATVKRIADIAATHRLAAIAGFVPAFAQAGGLMAYGPDFPDLYRRAAVYVATILKGAMPADLPIQRPEKFQFVLNLKTAKALGLTIPQSLLLRADQVIDP